MLEQSSSQEIQPFVPEPEQAIPTLTFPFSDFVEAYIEAPLREYRAGSLIEKHLSNDELLALVRDITVEKLKPLVEPKEVSKRWFLRDEVDVVSQILKHVQYSDDHKALADQVCLDFLSTRMSFVPLRPSADSEIFGLLRLGENFKLWEELKQGLRAFAEASYRELTGKELPPEISGKEYVDILALTFTGAKEQEVLGRPEETDLANVSANDRVKIGVVCELLSYLPADEWRYETFHLLTHPLIVAELQDDTFAHDVVRDRILNFDFEKADPTGYDLSLLDTYKPSFHEGEEFQKFEIFLRHLIEQGQNLTVLPAVMEHYGISVESETFREGCYLLAASKNLVALENLFDQLGITRHDVFNRERLIHEAEKNYRKELATTRFDQHHAMILLGSRNFPKVLDHYWEYGLALESIPIYPENFDGFMPSIELLKVKSPLIRDKGRIFPVIRTGEKASDIIYEYPAINLSIEMQNRGFAHQYGVDECGRAEVARFGNGTVNGIKLSCEYGIAPGHQELAQLLSLDSKLKNCLIALCERFRDPSEFYFEGEKMDLLDIFNILRERGFTPEDDTKAESQRKQLT